MITAMDFGAIVNRALVLVRENLVLWKLGLLAILTEGAANGWSWSWPSPPVDEPPTGAVDPELDKFINGAGQWFRENWELAVLAGVIGFLLMLLLWYLSLRAKGGLILEIERLEDGKTAGTFREIYGQGKVYVWKLFVLHLVFFLFVTLVSAVIALLLGGLVALGNIAAVFGFIAVLPFFVVFMVYVSFLLRISERHVVLRGGSIISGARLAHSFIRNRFAQSLISVAIEFGLGMLFMLLVFGVVVISVGIGALFVMLISSLLPPEAIVYVVALLVVLLVAGIYLIAGYFATYMATYWTLIYRALSYLENKIVKGG
jgi:hypothetical protein